ncbi:MAG: SLC13 family permease [Caldisphaera sp.]|nr:SLC13 family permease [Caldisphaera sp.]
MPKQYLGLIILTIIIGGFITRAKIPKIPAWSIMSFSASLSIIFKLIPINDINNIVDWNVILFLIGMFSLVSIAEASGILDSISAIISSYAKGKVQLLYLFSLFFGVLAAFMVNDAVAVVGTSLSGILAKIADLPLEPVAILLAFSITIGSTMTPLGNPQNMLIATQTGIKAPLITFLAYLAIPTIINIFLTTYIITKVYKIKNTAKKEFYLGVPQELIKNKRDAYISITAIIITVLLILVNDILELEKLPHINEIGIIPFTVAAFTYIFVSDARNIISKVNWGTIIFFITMFIATQGIWNSGILYLPLHAILPTEIHGPSNIFRITFASLIFSQLISNVPFTNVFIIYLQQLGYSAANSITWTTLAMSTTIAGNLTILGAASNVIILEILETKFGSTISYSKFMKIGIPITILNTLVYLAFIILYSFMGKVF